ncbi:minor tail protein [Mycobacterium phage Rope]|uniref:Minor tail protein n=1 Tax=Mycobacterium phage Rope TaxID=2767563 RepID=A0A7G9V087_9CAUD|nr:minor tail protein [Mycobacterium phage Rope]
MTVGWWAENFSAVEAELKPASASLSAEQPHEGDLESQVLPATADMVGNQPFTATIESEAQPAEATFAGALQPEGNLESALGRAYFGATAEVRAEAAMEVRLIVAGMVAQGEVRQQGSVAAQLAPLVAGFAGEQPYDGDLESSAKKAVASLSGWMAPEGSLGAQTKLHKASFSGGVAQEGSLTPQVRATSFVSTAIVANEVTFAAASAGTNVVTANPLAFTITPSSAGEDVVVWFACDRSATIGAVTIGGNPLRRMSIQRLTSTQSSNAFLCCYVGKSTSNGSHSISVALSGSRWAVATAVSYKDAQALHPIMSTSGRVSATVAQSVTCPPSGMVSWGLCIGGGSTFSSVNSGSTERFWKTGSSFAMMVRDANANTTFGGILPSTTYWAAQALRLSPIAIQGPRYNNYGEMTSPSLGNSSASFTVLADAGDDIIVGFCVDRGTDQSITVTCAGNNMTLLGTQLWSGAGANARVQLYRYANVPSANPTIQVTLASNSGWFIAGGISVKGMTSAGTTSGTNGNSTNAAQSVTCGANQLIVQCFAFNGTFGQVDGGATLVDTSSGNLVTLALSISDVSTTFTHYVNNNWGSIAVVLS